MTGVLLVVLFVGLMLAGVPIAVALGLGGMVAIGAANADSPWWGLLAAPQNMHASIAKYPLLALPMFVLVGSIFDRSGVARRMVTFAEACVGRAPGTLPAVAILVAMVLGGISGSGPANAAAVGGVMIAAMSKAGYPAAFSASIVGAAAATDILIPPSIAFIVYSVNVPGASVPALFAAGMVPGILAGVALIVPAVLVSRQHGFGEAERGLPRPPFWRSLGEAAWGLAAPVLILGGMRVGWFTPTEAAVVAVAYGLFIGMAVHRSIGWRDLYSIFREASEVSAVIMLVLALAGIFAYSVNTLEFADPLVAWVKNLGLGSIGTLILLFVVMTVLGMVLDGVSIFLVFLPLLYPLMIAFNWDPVWFGVLLTMKIAIGQFTPPMAVNLMVACRIAKVRIDETIPGSAGSSCRSSPRRSSSSSFRKSRSGCRDTWATDPALQGAFAMTTRRVVLHSLGAAAAAALGLPRFAYAQSAYKAEYRMSTVVPPAFAWGKGGEIFLTLVKERTNGRINIKQYPGASLVQGQQDREFSAMRQGVIDVLCGAPINWTSTVPQLGIFTLPFLMPDHRAWDAVMGHESLMKDYFDLVRKAGAEPLAVGETGYRQISNSKRPLIKPDDLKGLKVRVVGSPIYGEIMTSMGANPTFMSFADAQPALASGAIDGQENPLEVFLAAKIHTLGQKYVTKWNYSNDILLFAIAAPLWATWTPTDQKIVREAAIDAAKQQVLLVRKLFAEDVERVSALGVAVHVPTAPEMDAWQIAARRPYARYKAQTEPRLVTKVEEIVAKTRKA